MPNGIDTPFFISPNTGVNVAEEQTTQNGTDPEPTPIEAEPTPTEADKTFSQADLDRIVAERLAREKAKYQDYGDLKKAKAELDTIKEAQLTETERLQKQLADAQEQMTLAQRTAEETLIKSEIVSIAARLNFHDPEQVYRLVERELLEVKEGKVAGAEDAVKSLAEKSPYLIKQQQGQSLADFNPSGDTGQVRETDDQRRARLYGDRNSLFSQTEVERLGGGVVWQDRPKE